jgi:predicted secreted Zn-dependent protease
LLVGVFQIGNVNAKVTIKEQTEFYQIAPRSPDEIKFELRAKSPISKQRKQYHGQTTWTVTPLFKWKRIGRYCRVQEVNIQLDTLYLMPQLDALAQQSSDIRQRFEPYFVALVEHEKGHHGLGVKAARKIEEYLLAYFLVKSCSQLASEVSVHIQKVIGHYKMQNQDYDKQTGYGRTQGAVIR